MEEKNEEINSYKDIDLNSISVDLSDDDDGDDVIVQGGDYSGGGSKKKIIIISGVVVGVIILILGSFFIFKSLSNNNNKKVDQKVEQTSQGSKEIFKTSIKGAVDSQAAKYELSLSWKDATLEYGQSGNLESFQNKLQDVNTKRSDLLATTTSNDNDLNKLVTDSLNNMRTYLEKAYNTNNPEDAIDIYNEWQESDGVYDKEYLDKLTDLLDKNKIKYEIDDHNGGTKIEY